MKMGKKNNKGFTLIELVIVIAVLAVLAVIAVPAVRGIIDDANKSVDESNVALMNSAIEMQYAKTGVYPNSSSTAITAITTYTKIKAPIPAPKSAASGQGFVYDTSSNEVRIGITSGTAILISDTK